MDLLQLFASPVLQLVLYPLGHSPFTMLQSSLRGSAAWCFAHVIHCEVINHGKLHLTNKLHSSLSFLEPVYQRKIYYNQNSFRLNNNRTLFWGILAILCSLRQ